MRPIETVLPPRRWTLEHALDLAELFVLFLAHPSREGARVGFLHRGRLDVSYNAQGAPLTLHLVGSPCTGPPPRDAHCAPELRSGASPDLHADLYLLAVLLYETLTGRPFPVFLHTKDRNLPSLRSIPVVDQLFKSLLDVSYRRSRMRPAYICETIHTAQVENHRRVVTWDVGQASTLGGASRRLRNQDACGSVLLQKIVASQPTALGLLTVSDGIGSTSTGGEVAAFVVSQAQEAFLAELDIYSAESVVEHIDQHTRRIAEWTFKTTIEECERNSTLRLGGATCSMIVLAGRRVCVAHLGDSRAYLITCSGDIVLLSRDQTMAGAAYVSGRISWDEAHTDWGHVLMRYLGAGQSQHARAHLLTTPDIFPEERFIELCEGDTLLLMSDGVSGPLTEDALVELVRNAPTGHSAAQAITRAVEAAGGDDNTTILVARPQFAPGFTPPPFGPPGLSMQRTEAKNTPPKSE